MTPIQVDVSYNLSESQSVRRRRQAVEDINKFPILLIVNQTDETSVTSFSEKVISVLVVVDICTCVVLWISVLW